VWEVSTSGPFDRWPTGEGFEYFCGFLAGESNQWAPTLYEGTTPVEPPAAPDYHLTPDLVQHATRWVQAQQVLTPDKPFCMQLVAWLMDQTRDPSLPKLTHGVVLTTGADHSSARPSRASASAPGAPCSSQPIRP
jgi:arylsulfatase A-like enzyme